MDGKDMKGDWEERGAVERERERKGREERNGWKAGKLRTKAGEEKRKRKAIQDRYESWRKVGHREMDKTRIRRQ